MYRTYRGSSVGKKSVEDLLESRSFKNTKFMVDRGFFSDTVLQMMSMDGNCYIIPLAVSNKNVKRIKKTLQYTSGEFVYKSGRKDTARIIYYEEQIDEATRIIVYKDVDENNSKRKSYQQLMDMGENNYTQENYDKYCNWWVFISCRLPPKIRLRPSTPTIKAAGLLKPTTIKLKMMPISTT